jgi:pimeloyl-ACP methyl ester carboxylesterase
MLLHLSKILALFSMVTVAGACAPGAGAAGAQPPAAAAASVRTGYVDANGLRYYYEVHGTGEPLLLLHGGLGSIDMFAPVLPKLAANHQVIAVDLHGHGRTALGERKISLPDIADDLAVVLDRLGYAQVDAVGYSFGGGAALRLAIQHPAKVRRLVVVSAPYAQDGFYPEMLPQQAAVSAALAPMMKDTPMYKSYVAVAPHPDDFPRLLDRMGELMRTPYDWSAEVKALAQPVMLVYGDSDMVHFDHIVAFYHLLGGGQRDAGWGREHMAKNRLAILPDVTHYDMFLSPLVASTVLTFLGRDAGGAPATWAEQVGQR